MELSIEQQLQVRLFQDKVAVMSEETAKAMLIEMFKQWLDQENRIKAGMMGLAQGLAADIEALTPEEPRGWGEE